MSDKKAEKLPLRNMDDCVEWFERIANDATQDPHSIAKANARAACVKGVMGLHKLMLDYRRFASKAGTTIL